MNKSKWISLIVAVITMLAAIAVVPEFRDFLGLQRGTKKTVAISEGSVGADSGTVDQRAEIVSSPGSTVYQGQVIVVQPPPTGSKEAQKARKPTLPSLPTHEQTPTKNQVTYDQLIERFASKIEEFFSLSEKKVLVLDFTSNNGDVRDLGKLIAEDVSNKLNNIRRGFKVQNRQELSKVIGENSLTFATLTDPLKMKRVKKEMGIHAIITGTIFSLGKELKINCKVIDAENSEVLITSDGSLTKSESTMKGR